MPIEPSKTRLPLQLSKIILKLSSVFLSRLILLEEYQSPNKIVGHYDHQCEGIDLLVALFKKRNQAFLIKSFTKIRQHDKITKQTPTDCTNMIPATKRTYNSNGDVSQIQHSAEIPKSLIEENEEENVAKQQNISQQNRMQILLLRVKQINAQNSINPTFKNYVTRTDRDHKYGNLSLSVYAPFTTRKGRESLYNQRQPSEGGYDKNSYNYRQSISNTVRTSRRMFIMDKFRELESNLQRLKGGQTTGMSAELMKDIQILKSQLRNKKSVHV